MVEKKKMFGDCLKYLKHMRAVFSFFEINIRLSNLSTLSHRLLRTMECEVGLTFGK